MPITDLANLTLSGNVAAGGSDTVMLDNGSDSVLNISPVWPQSEFNVVGNAGGSQTDFNNGSSVTVLIALNDGSTSAPTCVADAGSAGESNTLTLGNCTAAGGSSPSIEFTEAR